MTQLISALALGGLSRFLIFPVMIQKDDIWSVSYRAHQISQGSFTNICYLKASTHSGQVRAAFTFQDLSEHTLKYRMCLRGNGFLFHKNATLMGKKWGKKEVNVLYFCYNQAHESTFKSIWKIREFIKTQKHETAAAGRGKTWQLVALW